MTRRNGAFRYYDINAALAKPVLEKLVQCWEHIFGSPERLIGGFQKQTLRAIDDFAGELSLSAAPSAAGHATCSSDKTSA